MAVTQTSKVNDRLEELAGKLSQAAGANLLSLTLYGSAAGADYIPDRSDLNLLVVLQRLEPADMVQLADVLDWWNKSDRPPLLMTLRELQESADVFAIELSDIKARNRVLYGRDVVRDIEVPMHLHRVQVEHELRSKLIQLRQSYLALHQNEEGLLRLMMGSSSTFFALFRHALIAMGRKPSFDKRENLKELRGALGVDIAAFDRILDLRERRLDQRQVDVDATFRQYIFKITRVIEAVNNRAPRSGAPGQNS